MAFIPIPSSPTNHLPFLSLVPLLLLMTFFRREFRGVWVRDFRSTLNLPIATPPQTSLPSPAAIHGLQILRKEWGLMSPQQRDGMLMGSVLDRYCAWKTAFYNTRPLPLTLILFLSPTALGSFDPCGGKCLILSLPPRLLVLRVDSPTPHVSLLP